ncbi:hypothetical protein B4N84_16450 [Flavobacterium sp. IR1]|nr:hypothetical protein B4N84_16450 [Flavobacterium sp. IR1]
MEWLKKMRNGMDLKWFFSIIFAIPVILYSQKKDFKNQPISFEGSALILFPYDFEIPSEHDEITETSKKSKIAGANLFVNYYILNLVAFRIGSGYEFINQPKIEYIPITGGIKLILNDSVESLFITGDIGGHLGKIEKFGVLLRIGVGYRFVIYKKILGDFQLYYSHQNLYKTFINTANQKIDYHNIESAGLKIGIEI